MAEGTAPAPEFKANTEYGMGFMPVLQRAWIRTLIVANSVFRGYGITNEEAIAELQEASEYMNNISVAAKKIMGAESRVKLESFRKKLQELSDSMHAKYSGKPKEALGDEEMQNLRNVTNLGFALMSQMDKELLGLPDAATDPGQKL